MAIGVLPTQNINDIFAIPGFRALWSGAVLQAGAQWTERVAAGWFIFESTNSAFLTSAAVSMQMGPGLFVGPIAGAISDRSRRPRVLSSTAGVRAALTTALAFAVAFDAAPLALVFALLACSGVTQSLHFASLHTLSGDLGGPARRARSISLVSVGQRGIAAGGAIAGGVLISTLGAPAALGTAALACTLAALLYRTVREPLRLPRRASTSLLSDTVGGLIAVSKVPLVSMLLGLMIVVEIFGYSFFALLPTIADRVVHVGPAGLGGLNAAPAIGAVVGLLVLAAYSDRMRLGLAFLVIFGTFGVLMIVIGSAPWYALSFAAAVAIGSCTALIDAIEWILLQQAVDEHLRGRVLGAWNVAIGFGWIVGPLTLGAFADATSVGLAFGIAGTILIVTSAISLVVARQLRAA